MISDPHVMAALAAPFADNAILWRVGSKFDGKGQALPYVDRYTVMQRFDDVFGVNWQNQMVVGGSGIYCCRIGLYLNGQWVWREDGTAAGHDPDIPPNADQKVRVKLLDENKRSHKSALSDAFKRCARLWGVGRYIEHAFPRTYVELYKEKYIAKHEEDGLSHLVSEVHKRVRNRPFIQMKQRLSETRNPSQLEEFQQTHAGLIQMLPDDWSGKWDSVIDEQRAKFNGHASGHA